MLKEFWRENHLGKSSISIYYVQCITKFHIELSESSFNFLIYLIIFPEEELGWG